MFCDVLSCDGLWCDVLWCDVLLCNEVLCGVMWWYVMGISPWWVKMIEWYLLGYHQLNMSWAWTWKWVVFASNWRPLNREHDEFPLEGSPILRPAHYFGHWRGTWNCTGLQNWKDSIPWLNPSHPVVKVYVSMKIPMDVIWIGWFSRSEPHIFINLPLKSQIPAWCRYVPFGNPNHTPKDDIRVPYLLGKLGF